MTLRWWNPVLPIKLKSPVSKLPAEQVVGKMYIVKSEAVKLRSLCIESVNNNDGASGSAMLIPRFKLKTD